MNFKSSGQQAPLTVRPAGAAEKDVVLAVVAAAFGAKSTAERGQDVARLVAALDEAGKVAASLVADVGGEVVGHVQLNHSWLDARERLVDVLVLSPLSVAPGRQRQGIGSALVTAAIDAAGAAGGPLLFLEGDPDYYGARGFDRASRHGFAPPSPRIPDAAFQVVVLPGHEPWMRGPLVYCEPFWAHDCVGLRDPRLAAVDGV